MANVRIAQIGQVCVNQPFYEVFANGKRYVFAVNEKAQVELKTPRFLKDLGVFSSVANQFQQRPLPDVVNWLQLDSAYSTVFDQKKFPYKSSGTGFAFVSDWKIDIGWKDFGPASSLSL